jgi:raffinose/stachyose/melibiose transport system substrate-binding protein
LGAIRFKACCVTIHRNVYIKSRYFGKNLEKPRIYKQKGFLRDYSPLQNCYENTLFVIFATTNVESNLETIQRLDGQSSPCTPKKEEVMRVKTLKRVALAAVAGASASAIAFSGIAPAQAATTTITWLSDNGPSNIAVENALVKAFEKANPGIKVALHTRPGGADGDNLVKTKLATGAMEDVFNYNSGALLVALNPAKTLVDQSKFAYQKNVYDSFKPAVSVGKKIFGAPWGTAMGGGIYYNIPAFKKAGITSTPKTWAELITAAKALKASGVDAICATFADSWTAQLFVLADFYNVHAANATFAADYTNNKAKYAYNPAALAGFQHLEEAYKQGLYNADATTLTFPDGVARVSSGKCGMYPMLTFATSAIPAANTAEVGFMAQPGTNAKNVGLTTWMPSGMYIPKSTKRLAAATKFVNFIASKGGTDAFVKGGGYQGPFVTKDQSAAPSDIPQATKDLSALVKSGKTYPALEFLSAIKGPSLPGITVQIATGQVTAKAGAALYDQDVVAQAQQLGIKGW